MKKHKIVLSYFKERVMVDIDKHIQAVANRLGILGDTVLVDEEEILYHISKDLSEHFGHLAERIKP